MHYVRPIACNVDTDSMKTLQYHHQRNIPPLSTDHALRLSPLLEHGKLVKPRASIRSPAENGAGLSNWLRADVPKKLFTHFYAFGFLTSTAVLADVLFRGGAVITAGIQVYKGCVFREMRPGFSYRYCSPLLAPPCS